MAKYYTNFSEYTTGQQPSVWTKRWYVTNTSYSILTNSSCIGGKLLRESTSTNAFYRAITWNAIDSDANNSNVEVLAKVRTTDLHALYFNAFVCVRMSGLGNVGTGYIAGIYGGSYLKIFKNVSGTKTELGSCSFNHSANTWYWIKFKANGTSLSVKAWVDGSIEPESWQISANDSAISAVGWTGVGGESDNTYRDFDIVGIGTNGDPALKQPTVTSNAATEIKVTTATLNGNLTDTGGENCNRYFEYGTTAGYGTVLNAGSGPIGPYSSIINNLLPNTIYHYRTYVTNGVATTYGSDMQFTTADKFKPILSSPNNTNLSPLSDNVFKWQIDSEATQTHFELQYRSIGGSWKSTGEIVSSVPRHILKANNLSVDTNYEWRVKSWDSNHPTWYDWSNTMPFSAVDIPGFSDMYPEYAAQIQFGVVNVSTKVSSLSGRNCRLNLLVADNSEFTNPKSYQTAFMPNGSTCVISAGMVKCGINYLRFTVEDTSGVKNSIEYYVNVFQNLYFITEPSVQIQGPQATHVTVRVRDSSPVVEYTAFISPEPTIDKRIERLVEIDSGTAATCQTVAEQLVARWGREQKSVSGDINLTVTLSFLEKVHVMYPQAGIDEEMILQKKEHRVTDMITQITCGDILLDDSELLARILDELGK